MQRFWHHAKRLAVGRYLPPGEGDFCLDVGCGSGVISDFVGQRCRRVVGIDCSPDAIDFASGKFGSDRVSFRLGMVDKNLEIEEPVDKIYCTEVIEHVYFTQAEPMLRGLWRVLKPGGAVLLTTPNAHSLWPAIEWTMDRLGLAPKMDHDQHVAQYSRQSLARLCHNCGFSVETVGTMCFLAPWLAPVSWRLAERCFGWESRLPHLPGSILVGVFRKR